MFISFLTIRLMPSTRSEKYSASTSSAATTARNCEMKPYHSPASVVIGA